MGKMKALSQNFIGYTVDATIYFKEDSLPEQARDFIDVGRLSADGVKSVINRVRNRGQRNIPTEATIFIYKTYELDNIKYSQLAKTVTMSANQCKDSWLW